MSMNVLRNDCPDRGMERVCKRQDLKTVRWYVLTLPTAAGGRRDRISPSRGLDAELSRRERRGETLFEYFYMALVEGCVRVRSGNHVVVAKPNEQVALDLESRKISTKEVDAARLVAWKDGVLMIKNEPFVDVIRRLERWFGVEIENQCLQSSALLFSGVFERSGLEVVLQTICANLNINYVIDGNRVILKN